MIFKPAELAFNTTEVSLYMSRAHRWLYDTSGELVQGSVEMPSMVKFHSYTGYHEYEFGAGFETNVRESTICAELLNSLSVREFFMETVVEGEAYSVAEVVHSQRIRSAYGAPFQRKWSPLIVIHDNVLAVQFKICRPWEEDAQTDV